uniref:Thioredoxin domain-containing protein n=1 Tax=Nelumbo nucifera TaxID=4432 RepID=A0A822XNU9_NELNU|nr:TPA_asm: hypothetical protein HUJ06_023430 [Nelumbo nucifera]
MATTVWQTGFALLLVFGRLTCAEPVRVSSVEVCPMPSLADYLLLSRDLCVDSSWLSNGAGDLIGVTERALNLVHKNGHEYISLLFHASWCPFSRACRPTFSILSSLYPSIRHLAVEESSIRPSILSRYGVHGFPTLFLLNSTMRVRYQGSRTLNSLVAFYNDVTGIKPASLDGTSLEKIENPSNLAYLEDPDLEGCPFSWARSPENLLRQETYLALATTFVVLRLLHFLLPTLLAFVQHAWRRYVQNASLMSLWKYPLAYLKHAIHVFNVPKEPCKRNNLQEGAMSARAWASKSLASVSIGDSSSSKGYLGK